MSSEANQEEIQNQSPNISPKNKEIEQENDNIINYPYKNQEIEKLCNNFVENLFLVNPKSYESFGANNIGVINKVNIENKGDLKIENSDKKYSIESSPLHENEQNQEEPKEIIMERYVECNDVPILDEKIILKKEDSEQKENQIDDNKEEEINNLEQKENVNNEGKEEQNMENEQKEDNNNNEIQGEENNIKNVQENEEGEEVNDIEQENVNEIGEENICDEYQAEQQNEGNDEQKMTTTVQVLVPENQNEN
jgi:hypothetical protein